MMQSENNDNQEIPEVDVEVVTEGDGGIEAPETVETVADDETPVSRRAAKGHLALVGLIGLLVVGGVAAYVFLFKPGSGNAEVVVAEVQAETPTPVAVTSRNPRDDGVPVDNPQPDGELNALQVAEREVTAIDASSVDDIDVNEGAESTIASDTIIQETIATTDAIQTDPLSDVPVERDTLPPDADTLPAQTDLESSEFPEVYGNDDVITPIDASDGTESGAVVDAAGDGLESADAQDADIIIDESNDAAATEIAVPEGQPGEPAATTEEAPTATVQSSDTLPEAGVNDDTGEVSSGISNSVAVPSDGDVDFETARGTADNDELNALEASLQSITAALEEERAAAASLRGQLREQQSSYEARLSDQAANFETRLAEMQARIEEASSPAIDANTASASLVLVELSNKADAGMAFESELGVLAQYIRAAPELERLSVYAESGVATAEELRRDFRVAARDGLNAALSNSPEGFMGRISATFGLRPATPQPGDSASAVISRMEAAVRSSDFALALREREALNEAGRTATSQWAEQTQRYIAVQEALTVMRQRLISAQRSRG